MSKYKKILMIILATLPFLIAIGFSSWIIINVKEFNDAPQYNYEDIIKDAYGDQKKDYTGNGLGPESTYEEEIIDSDSFTFEYYDTITSTWIKGLPVESGTYTVRVVNKYDSSSQGVEITFTINKSGQQLTVQDLEVIYDGESHQIDESSIVVNFGNKADGALVITGNIARTDVGTTTVSIKVLGNDNFNEFNSSVSIIVKHKDLNDEDVVAVVKPRYVYDGTEKRPSYDDLQITYNGMTLTTNDYIIEKYENNVNATNDTNKACITIKAHTADGCNYTGTKKIYFDIAKADQNPSFETSKTYDGLAANITITTNDSITATPSIQFYNQDYQMIDNPTNVALNGLKYYVKISITGNNNYKDFNSDYIEYTINPLNINNESIKIDTISDIKCTGFEIPLPKPTISFNANNLVEGNDNDYVLSYYTSNNEQVTQVVNVGSYKVRITGVGNFTGYAEVEFNVIKNQITDTTINVEDATYTSNQITPNVTIEYNGKTLLKDKDFTLDYDSIIDAGNYEITIKGIGIFEGSTTASLIVNKADFANVSITIADVKYTGAPINVVPIVTFNGNNVSNSNFEFAIYQNDNLTITENVGSYEMRFTGSNNFSGTNSEYFNVIERNVSDLTFDVPETIYNGTNQLPVVSAKYNGNNITLQDYEVEYTYTEFINATTYTLTINGKNNLTGSTTVSYKINPKDITADISLDDITVRYDGNPHTMLITGVLPNGVNVTYENNTQTEIGNYTVTAKITDTTGNYIVLSTLTATLSITDKDDIKVELIDTTVIYTGEGQTIDIKLYDSEDALIEDEDLINDIKSYILLTYDNATDSPINVKLNGQTVLSYNVLTTLNFNDEYNLIYKEGTDNTATLTINPYVLTEDNVEDITETFVYDGTKKEPSVTIKYNQMILDNSIDYTLHYGENTNVSTGGIVGILGIGNYKGEVEILFNIEPASISLNDSDWPSINPFVENMMPTLSKTSDTISGVKGNFEFKNLTDASKLEYQGTTETFSGKINVSFNPTNSNYSSVTKELNYTMYAVAYIGSTYYGTINDALNEATDGTEVYVVTNLGMAIPVVENITIPSGTSLYLQYDNINNVYKTPSNQIKDLSSSTYADSTANNVNANRVIFVKMLEGADIIVSQNANLYLGGQARNIGITGKYAEINLDTGSSIKCKGSFYCYGYIKENSVSSKNGSQMIHKDYYDNSFDDGRLIIMENGSNLYAPASFYDVSPTTTMYGLNGANVFPLNIIDFSNIQTYLQIDVGATFIAESFVYDKAADEEIITNETITVIGSQNKSMFKLNSGNIVFEYCPTDALYTNKNAITRVYINGEIVQGYISINIKLKGIPAEISSEEVFLPISYKFNLFVNETGTYYTDYKVKFLPGSILQNNGGHVTINNEVIFYDSEFAEDVYNYPKTYQDAKLINNGLLTIDSSGKIAALIETTDLTGLASIDLSKVTDSTKFTVSSVENLNAVSVSKTSSGYFQDSSDERMSIYQFVAGSYVTSSTQGLQCWVGDKYALRNINVVIEETGNTYDVYQYEVYVATDSSGNEKTLVTFDENGYSQIAAGKYVQIVVTRSKSATINEEALNSNVWYEIVEDITIKIVPNKGRKIHITTNGGSGNSDTTFTAYEKSPDGTEITLGQFKGINNTGTFVYVVDGWQFKVNGKDGLASTIGAQTELDSNSHTKTIVSDDGTLGATSSYTNNSYIVADNNYELYFHRKAKENSSPCIVEGTLITMADGTQKPVEEVVAGDKVLVFNHETGKFEVSIVMYNIHSDEDYSNYEIVWLHFSDGTSIGIHAEHYFFDIDLNKYVLINHDNISEFINHRFYAITYDEVTGNYIDNIITLDSYSISYEYTRVYGPMTANHLNLFAEGLLNIAGDNDPFINIFEYDENMKYDEELKQADIEKYGLFTYEDFKDYITEDIFNAYNGQYLKVAIGKGYTTFERVLELIEKYLVDMGYGDDYKEDSKEE